MEQTTEGTDEEGSLSKAQVERKRRLSPPSPTGARQQGLSA